MVLDASSLESVNTPECQIGETHFLIDKLPAMQAWRVLERIRHELAKTEVTIPTNGQNPDALLRSVLSLDPAFVEGLRRDIFAHVRFTNARAQTPQQLASAEDMAFDGLEPVAIYEVMLRALAVNFMPSFREIGSRLGAGGLTSIP